MSFDLVPRQEGEGGGAGAGGPWGPISLSPEFIAEDRSSQIVIIHSVLFSVAFAVVLLRIYVRIFLLRAFSIDDYIMVAATICSIGTQATIVGESKHGLGRHFMAITMNGFDDYQVLAKYMWANSLLIVTGISLVKISLGFFLLRFAQKAVWKRFIIGMIAFLVAFTLACVGTLIFQCTPVSAAWNFTQRLTARCFSNDNYIRIGLFNNSINIITDFIFATMPIPMFWKIQVRLRRKIVLMAILSLGYFACGASIVRAVLQGKFNENPDPTWNFDYYIWNSVEFHVGILSASLPTLRPLFKSILGTTVAVTTGARSHKYKRSGYSDTSNIGLEAYRGSNPNQRSGGRHRMPRGGEYGWDERDSYEEGILLDKPATAHTRELHALPPHIPTSMASGVVTTSGMPQSSAPATILRTTEISVRTHSVDKDEHGGKQPPRNQYRGS